MVRSSNEKIRYLIRQKYHYCISGVDRQGIILLTADVPLVLERQVEEYCKELEAKPANEINDLYKAACAKEEQDKQQHRAQLEMEAEEFLNHSHIRPRYEYWARMAYWSIEEAVPLSLNIDPKLMAEMEIPRGVKILLALKVRELEDQVRRAVEVGELDDPLPPVQYMRWVKRHNLDFPTEISERITPEAKPEKPSEKPLSTRERETLLKILGVMAIKGYCYKPGASKNPCITEIANDLAEHGITISDDTIRDKLKEAVELIPQIQDA